jgi:Tol biopolymer transport system component
MPSTLSLIDVTVGDISEIALLPGSELGARDAGSVTGMGWSPDGRTLAVSLRHREPDPDHDGIWLLDVANGEMAHILTITQAEALFASVFPDVALEVVGPVFWSQDGNTLLFWLSNPLMTPVAQWALTINVNSREATAISLPSHPRDTGERRGIWPLQAAWSPDGGSLLVAANGLHPDDEQILLDPENRRVRTSVYLVDAQTAESTLLGHLPPGEAVPLYLSTWSEDNNVILNGYHLVMERQ